MRPTMTPLKKYALLCLSLLFTVFSCQKESTNSDAADAPSDTALETGGNVALSQGVSMELIAIFAQEMSKAGILEGFETGKLTTRGGGPKVQLTKTDGTYYEASLDFGAGTSLDKRIIAGKLIGKIWKNSKGELIRMVVQPENLNIEKHSNSLCNSCTTNGATNTSDKNFTISGCTFYKGTMTLGNISKCVSGAYKNKYLFRVKVSDAIIGTPKNRRSFGFEGLADCAMIANDGNANYVADPAKFMDALVKDYENDSYEVNVLEGFGVDYKGRTYRAVSRGTIAIDFACSWPKKGVMDVYCQGWLPNFSVNFGDGACDNLATLKVSGCRLLFVLLYL
jgi:hypothetical protein